MLEIHAVAGGSSQASTLPPPPPPSAPTLHPTSLPKCCPFIFHRYHIVSSICIISYHIVSYPILSYHLYDSSIGDHLRSLDMPCLFHSDADSSRRRRRPNPVRLAPCVHSDTGSGPSAISPQIHWPRSCWSIGSSTCFCMNMCSASIACTLRAL